MHPTRIKNVNLNKDSQYDNIFNNKTLMSSCENNGHKLSSDPHSRTNKIMNEKTGDTNNSMSIKKSNVKQYEISPFVNSQYQTENNSKKKENIQNNSFHKSIKNKKGQKNTIHIQQKKCQNKKLKISDGQCKKKEGISKNNKNTKTKKKQKSKSQQQVIITRTIKNRSTNTNRGQLLVNKSEQGQTKLIIDLTNKNKKQSNKRSTNRLNSKSSHANIKLNNHNHCGVNKLLQIPSTRQYCIIKGKFVPLQFTTDRKRLDNIFLQTACTSPDISHKRFLNQTQAHNQTQVSSSNQVSKTSPSTHVEIGVQTIKKQLANYQVLVKAAQQDVGIQYSDRLNPLSGRKCLQIQRQVKQKVKLRLQQIQKSKNLTEPQKSQRSVLLDAMMKLQTLQLDQNFVLDKLNREQKNHFREIFSSLMLKMKSPRSDLPLNCTRNSQQVLLIQGLKKGKQKDGVSQQKNEELEHVLMMRQSRQINQLNIFVAKSNQQFDTSLFAVLSTFADIFCYVQMNHQDSVIKSMNNLYGLSYTDKFLSISKFYSQKKHLNDKKNFPISSRLKLQILNKQHMQKTVPDYVFRNFIEQIGDQYVDQQTQLECKKVSQIKKITTKGNQKHIQSYKQIHSKCIFDSINQLLTPYRPFYSTKGDPFPWTMSPLKCLTFYSIDSQSLQTVVQQIQQKLIKILKTLCGLHIQPTMYVARDYQYKQQSKKWQQDRVFCIRREKLTKCIIQECQIQYNGQGDQYLQLQIDTTCILYQVSLLITQQLFQQLSYEISSIHARDRMLFR